MLMNLMDVSSLMLSWDLGVSQKTAWFMARCIREALDGDDLELFLEPVESDETCIGGKAKNMHKKRREGVIAGCGIVGKIPMCGVKDRDTNKVTARLVGTVDSATLTSEIKASTVPEASVRTDGAKACKPLSELGYQHESVAHSAEEYARGKVHTNGIESFWSMRERGYIGTYHTISMKHLGRHVNEFTGRSNMRIMNTI